jgi:hypothetical protein
MLAWKPGEYALVRGSTTSRTAPTLNGEKMNNYRNFGNIKSDINELATYVT